MDRLERHLGNLESLVGSASRFGARLPLRLFDVETPELRAVGCDVYVAAERLAAPDHASYLELLARAHDRHVLLRAALEAGSGAETALDTALDLLLLCEEVAAAAPRAGWLRVPRALEKPRAASLLAWQNLVTVAPRLNPFTRRPLSPWGQPRLTLPGAAQHAAGRALPLAEIWGVTGFHPRFVGVARNVNQVEHLAISLVLQAVSGAPLMLLDAVEWGQVLLSGIDPAEARADRALNRAIHDAFLPRFRSDLPGAVDALRRELRG